MKIIFDETIELHLKHPVTGEKLYLQKVVNKQKGIMGDDLDKPMLVEIYGKHTAKFKSVTTEMSRKIAQAGKELKKDSEEYLNLVEKETLNSIAKCIVGFKNVHIETEFGLVDGSNTNKAMNVWWIKDQINLAIADTKDFLQKPNKD